MDSDRDGAGYPDGCFQKDVSGVLSNLDLVNPIGNLPVMDVGIPLRKSTFPKLPSVKAVLELYLGGEAAGLAAVDLLYGSANPRDSFCFARFQVYFPERPQLAHWPHLVTRGVGDVWKHPSG